MQGNFRVFRLSAKPLNYPHPLGTFASTGLPPGVDWPGRLLAAPETIVNLRARTDALGHLWTEDASGLTAKDIERLQTLAALKTDDDIRRWCAATGAVALPGLGAAVQVLGMLRRLERDIVNAEARAAQFGLVE